MNISDTTLPPDIPDVRNIPPDKLAALGPTVLAHSIALAQQRLRENEAPAKAFNSGI